MNTKPLRTIRLTDTKIKAILDSLDAEADGQLGATALRGAVRYSYRADMIVVCLRQPASTELAAFHVATRDISATGISFLHGGFVHRTSRSVVMLVTRECEWHEVQGHVIECRYVTHNVHEVRVEFEKEIDVALFCESADEKRLVGASSEENSNDDAADTGVGR